MRILKRLFEIATDRKARFQFLEGRGVYDQADDATYIKKRYYATFGRRINLENPVTISEKLQWLKLYDRKPVYTTMADKYAVRDYLTERGAEELIVPLVGGPWKRFDEIDFDALPDRFVLKCTHDSGGLYICKDKSKMDKAAVKERVERSLRRNYFLHGREWPYKNIPPRIIAEQFLEDDVSDVLRVYKIFNFNGKPKIIQMITNDKTPEETINYYDTEWNLLNLRQNYPNGPLDERPAQLEEMLNWARVLSEGIPFLRTDFYITNGKIYFSEFTFYTDSGFAPYEPAQWDAILGSWIRLPEKEKS